MNESFVLDSFALLALLGGEPGSEEVAKLLRQAQLGEARVLMTWVNAGEVAYILERRFGLARLQTALALMDATGLEMVPLARELALLAAHLKAGHPIAYAGAIAAALAQQAAPDELGARQSIDCLQTLQGAVACAGKVALVEQAGVDVGIAGAQLEEVPALQQGGLGSIEPLCGLGPAAAEVVGQPQPGLGHCPVPGRAEPVGQLEGGAGHVPVGINLS